MLCGQLALRNATIFFYLQHQRQLGNGCTELGVSKCCLHGFQSGEHQQLFGDFHLCVKDPGDAIAALATLSVGTLHNDHYPSPHPSLQGFCQRLANQEASILWPTQILTLDYEITVEGDALVGGIYPHQGDTASFTLTTDHRGYVDALGKSQDRNIVTQGNRG